MRTKIHTMAAAPTRESLAELMREHGIDINKCANNPADVWVSGIFNKGSRWIWGYREEVTQ